MRQSFSIAAALAATFSLSNAASSAPTCYPGNPCPADTPCCSQYGQCGLGAYCLAGCDPQSSFDLKSCVATSVCKSANYKFNSLDDIVPNTHYLGDTSGANWVSSGTPVIYNDDSVLLTMAPDTVGTLLMSTHYVWYGKISATLSTSQGQGVVTAFIMMSDVKDEIDWEFVGVDLQAGQSNFYWQGVTDYTNGKNISTTNTVENMHTYTFDWTPEQLSWAIDGETFRTVKKSDTFNKTDNTYHYPQTPARVQLSLWPAGLSTNGKGTIDWAGGLINWNSPDMQNGYYYARVKEVDVQCYSPPSGTSKNGDSAYYYTNKAGVQADVAIGSNDTELASFYASGDKPDYNPDKSSGQKPKSTAQTVPGLSGGGARGGVSDGSGKGSGSASDGTGFVQGVTTSDASAVATGSAIALVSLFVVALML